MTEITKLLQKAQTGDASAREALFAAAYPVLEGLAGRGCAMAGGTPCWTRAAWCTSPTSATRGAARCAPRTGVRFSHLRRG